MRQAKSGKRIVSKGAYAKAQSIRLGLGMFGSGAFLIAIVSGIAACFCTLSVPIAFMFAVYDHEWRELLYVLISLFFLCTFGCIFVGLCCLGTAAMKKVNVSKIIPLTRANVADLPVTDTLVRASQEPMQAQGGVLLRAAVEEMQMGDGRQLLRMSVRE